MEMEFETISVNLIDVKPKDIYCLLEMRLEHLLLLRTALENCTIDFSPEIKDSEEAAEYIEKSFYPSINSIIKEIQE